ncbi:CAP domain-containing protein [Candidatus Saccharibacteria bacterium]|nr:CAP domain-containing protein [Candidatus Saccharibacteria bacterium]MDQ5885025.1 hypothetical protein [Patescibacteria group bacterium]MDQ5953525.1 hypothetical protein [Patescibacteria group bacterium]
MNWKKYLLVTFIALISLIGFIVYQESRPEIPVQSAVITPQVQDIPLDANKILELVNIERQKVGVASLTSDPRLVASAQAKADEMVANNYFGHVSPVTGVDGYTLIPNGICVYKSENISEMLNQIGDNNNDTVQGWVGSKAHYDAMVDSKYTLTGVAISKNKIVQHFCQTN